MAMPLHNDTRATLRGYVAALLTLAFVGCTKTSLMPTPVAYDGSGVDPLALTPDDRRTMTTRIFIATDRTPSGKTDPAYYFSVHRDDGLRLAVATVEVGSNMDWQSLHQASLHGKREVQPIIRLSAMEQYGTLWATGPPRDPHAHHDDDVASAFASEINAVLASSGLQEIFIFVHGFNTKVEANTELAAELYHYLGRQGAVLSYEWPSRGSMFAYVPDQTAAAYSVRYFRLLLSYLAEHTTAEQIHIIAHSAGAPIAVNGIRELRLMHFDETAEAVRSRYRIGHLVLVAPDMDLGLFDNAIDDETTGVPRATTIYISTRDRALEFSSWLAGFARLGASLTALTHKDTQYFQDHSEIELVDTAVAEKKHGSFLGHSYFHRDPWVSSDLLLTLRFGVGPAERALTKPDGKPVWGFPKDYPELVQAAARKLYPARAQRTTAETSSDAHSTR